MKTVLMVAGLILCSGELANCQSPAEEALFQRFTEGPDSAKALDTVMKMPEQYTPIILLLGARTAFGEKRLEDAAFLYYAAQIRARFDKECFPPKGEGGDNPFLAVTAIWQQLGVAINPAAMSEPKTFAKAAARVKMFQPKAPKEYEPGYEFKDRKSEKDALASTKASRDDLTNRMSDLAILLNDAEYFRNFRVVRDFNVGADPNRPTKDEQEKALESMKRIEKEMKAQGVLTK